MAAPNASGHRWALVRLARVLTDIAKNRPAQEVAEPTIGIHPSNTVRGAKR